MATTLEELVVKISTDISDLKDGLNQMRGETVKTTNIMAGVLGGGILKDAIYKIKDFVIDTVDQSIDAWRDHEVALNSLTQSMINAGTFTANLRNEYLSTADALQELTTFDDEAIVKAQSLLQAQLGNQKVTQELTKATLDLAAAKSIDLAAAADMVGKTIGGENNMLKRQGITFDETTSGAQRLAAVTDALNGKFAEQASQMAKGLGAIDQAKNAWGDFLEAIGGRLAPVVAGLAGIATQVLKIMTGVFKPAFDASTASTDQLKEKFKELTAELIDYRKHADLASPDVQKAITEKQAELDAIMRVVQDNHEKESQALTAAEENKRAKRAEARAVELAEIEKQNEAEMEALRNKYGMGHEAEAEFYAAKAENSALSYEERMAFQAEADAAEQEAITEKYGKELELLQQRHNEGKIKDDEYNKLRSAVLTKQAADEQNIENAKNKRMEQARAETLNTMATLQNSSNSTLKTIGKAAALTQIAISAPEGVAKALAAFPPPFNFIAAGAVGAAMAEQAAKVVGLKDGITDVPGTGFHDQFPAMLAPKERVVDRGTNEDLKAFLADPGSQGGGGDIQINLRLSPGVDFMEVVEEGLISRQRSGQSRITTRLVS